MNYYAPFYRPSYYPQMPMQNPPENQNQFGQYQQQMQMPMQNQPTPQPSNDMIWVLGEIEAQSYPVAPNNTVTLWDKNETTIYIKSVNAQGIPSMRILDFSERVPNAPKTAEKHECHCGDKFVSKDKFAALEKKFEALEAKFNSISAVTSNMEDN
ncbi:MAG: hypothetical protein J6S23_08435 [Clostridia bacterium]|nr:hypothetical protein [Clostridia bacterium]